MKKINVALAGLGFGGAFVEIYTKHPNVDVVGVFDPDEELTNVFVKRFGVKKYSSFEEMLNDKSIDAIHIISPIPCHEEQTVKVLEAGKHCACTVPMATTLEGLRNIIRAAKKANKNYMMMETTLYTYQFFYVQDMLKNGEFGKIQFLRGCHYQDMENWPDYWLGLPPMHYGTHAIAPMVVLSGSRPKRVVCFGSGTMDQKLVEHYGNPFPVESALFEFENGLKGEATRSLFETSRMYQEGMFVYGSKKSFEWGFTDGDNPYITSIFGCENGSRGRKETYEIKEMPNHTADLPEELWQFTVGENYDPLNPQKSLVKGAGGGHHGSHPHLVNEFVISIIEDRKPAIDEFLGADITACGICAHISAMNGGKEVLIPDFREEFK